MNSVHDNLRALCDLVGVPIEGLTLDELDVVAIRVALLEEPSPTAIANVVDSVRWARSIGCCTPKTYPGPTGLRRRHAWGCVWAGQPVGAERDPKLKVRQATKQVDELAERKATRRGARLSVHPACLSAWRDGGNPCSFCLYILCEDDECDHEDCARERGWDSYFGG